MAGKKQDAPVDLGVFSKSFTPQGLMAADWIALILTVIWLAGSGLFFLFVGRDNGTAGPDPITFIATFIAITMPVALIWVGAFAVRSARVMREESARLQAAIDAMRHSYIEQQQSHGFTAKPSVEKKLDQLVEAQREAQKQAETTIATFASSRSGHAVPRPVSPVSAEERDQPSLELGTPAEALQPPLSVDDFICAINFPETQDDQAGFNALRRALKDREASKLVRAAQDVLTLLSQDGIYMDDLTPDRARPEIWRRFAAGERGATVAALGGVRDRSCLALTAGRMRQDPIFRDAAHHFLRQFDRTLSAFEKEATDEELSRMAETRTARAFMLLGRVSGTFD